MQPRPRQAIAPGHQVLIKRLVLVPQKNNPYLSHLSLFPSLSIGKILVCHKAGAIQPRIRNPTPDWTTLIRKPMTTKMTPEHVSPVHFDVSLLSPEDFYLFNEGSHYRIYDKMGAHLIESHGTAGAVFGIWAPNARRVTVIGSFNNWNPTSHQLQPRGSSGIWEGFIPGVTKGTLYKFHIDSTQHGFRAEKADPVAILNEKP